MFNKKLNRLEITVKVIIVAQVYKKIFRLGIAMGIIIYLGKK